MIAVAPNSPLRLAAAAGIAFPDGSMTASGLRREAARGKLVISRVAGKDYTTLAAIARMVELCRRPQKVPACGSAPPAAARAEESATPPPGSSATADTSAALAAAHTIVAELSARSANTSRKSMSRRRAGNVIRPKFRSPT